MKAVRSIARFLAVIEGQDAGVLCGCQLGLQVDHLSPQSVQSLTFGKQHLFWRIIKTLLISFKRKLKQFTHVTLKLIVFKSRIIHLMKFKCKGEWYTNIKLKAEGYTFSLDNFNTTMRN